MTDVTRQLSSYLAGFVLEKDYTVHGIKRRSFAFNMGRIDYIYEEALVHKKQFRLLYWDLLNFSNLTRIINET